MTKDKIKKGTKFWVALLVPFIFIIIILVKIVHTINAGSSDPFLNKGGMVFVSEQFMQELKPEIPVNKAIYATILVKNKTDILEVIEKRKLLVKDNTRYNWISISVRDEQDEFWNVTYRENNISPKMICTSRVNISSGKVDELVCSMTDSEKIKNRG